MDLFCRLRAEEFDTPLAVHVTSSPIRSDPQQTGLQLVGDVDRETLGDLEWDDTAEWDDNQGRFREEIGKP